MSLPDRSSSTDNAAHTLGPWDVLDDEDGRTFIVGCKDGVRLARVLGQQGNPLHEGNACLLAEVGTVKHETGLTPRQLAHQLAELRAERLTELRNAEYILRRFRNDAAGAADICALHLSVCEAIAKATGGGHATP